MTQPTDVDLRDNGAPASALLQADPSRQTEVWAVAGLDDVQNNMRSTGYPPQRVLYVKGDIETTLPAQAPLQPIALLRLDTDWYASTRHELQHLYPLLASGGVLIIDDYGDWQGARRAVDEFLAALPAPPFLHRIDETGRPLGLELRYPSLLSIRRPCRGQGRNPPLRGLTTHSGGDGRGDRWQQPARARGGLLPR